MRIGHCQTHSALEDSLCNKQAASLSSNLNITLVLDSELYPEHILTIAQRWQPLSGLIASRELDSSGTVSMELAWKMVLPPVDPLAALAAEVHCA
jgi:hypothetical protein